MGLSKSLLGSQSISSQFPPLLQLAFARHGARKLILKAKDNSCFVCLENQVVQPTVTQPIEIILALSNASYYLNVFRVNKQQCESSSLTVFEYCLMYSNGVKYTMRYAE